MIPRNTGASAVIGAIVGGVPGNAISGGAGRTAATATTTRAGTAAPAPPDSHATPSSPPATGLLFSLGGFFGLKWPV
ncbi:hypothetical protein CVV70_05810 [Ralstonia solanacearum]|nr:hypothetical protein CCY86_04290 [Ralstonia solanacearum]PNQ31168.1 hypothetical protein CVS51_14045 [Ralstonia solanacearum]PNQ50472.1 hypothetical protein CVV70_05810 [Ralstonia solanacearum]